MGSTITDAGLHLERVTTPAALARLRPEWDRLWAAQPETSPFQHSAWLLPWWDVFGGDDELRVLALRDAGTLVALAPLYLHRSPAGGEIRLLGAGISDYLDVLAVPRYAPALVQALGDVLTGDSDWTFCGFDHLRPESPLARLVVPPPTVAVTTDEAPCPVLSLPPDPAALMGAISTKLSSNLRQARRRAERAGGLAIEHATADTVEPLLDRLDALHSERWRARGQPGVLRDPRVRAFHRRAAPALLAAGLLRLFVLRIGREVAAVHYGFASAGRTCFYLGAFDQRFATFSPGKLAIAAAIEQAIDEGAELFDFLSGREAYKYEWRAVDRRRLARHWRRGTSMA